MRFQLKPLQNVLGFTLPLHNYSCCCSAEFIRTEGKSRVEIRDLLSGENGSPVVLRLERQGTTLDVPLVRGVARIDSNGQHTPQPAPPAQQAGLGLAIEIADEGGCIVLDTVAGGAAQGCGKIFPGDLLLAVRDTARNADFVGTAGLDFPQVPSRPNPLYRPSKLPRNRAALTACRPGPEPDSRPAGLKGQPEDAAGPKPRRRGLHLRGLDPRRIRPGRPRHPAASPRRRPAAGRHTTLAVFSRRGNDSRTHHAYLLPFPARCSSALHLRRSLRAAPHLRPPSHPPLYAFAGLRGRFAASAGAQVCGRPCDAGSARALAAPAARRPGGAPFTCIDGAVGWGRWGGRLFSTRRLRGSRACSSSSSSRSSRGLRCEALRNSHPFGFKLPPTHPPAPPPPPLPASPPGGGSWAAGGVFSLAHECARVERRIRACAGTAARARAAECPTALRSEFCIRFMSCICAENAAHVQEYANQEYARLRRT